MKKKYEVLSLQTKSDLEYCGCSKWLKRTWWIWAIILIVTWVWAIYWGNTAEINGRNTLIRIAPMIICAGIWMIMYIRAGKKFWNKIKDKEQPFDLREE